MAETSKSNFTFIPHPEAHVMKWADLLYPVQVAVRDLLIRLEGANQSETGDNAITASSFLVYGDRGTGKTTVLLCAKEACTSENFFPEKDPDEDPLLESARKSADKLKNVVWLDVLDLEPLSAKTNLLTTLLTRVNYSIHPSPGRRTEVRSILEESKESARKLLNDLITDATLMWEDISETDTRSRAHRQVAAAEIYAQFHDKFNGAMNALSNELGRRKGADNCLSIILPIDNIDRSTEHLHSIVKLAQMVSCPHLWLVMAGDRQDVDTFLERAYWKELISFGEGAGAAGKTGLGGEDEALVMARRQAAAASHKLLPPSHRIGIRLVNPSETLAFSFPGNTRKETIRDLLEKIEVVRAEQDPTRISSRNINLLDLFYLDKFFKSGFQENGIQPGERAGREKKKKRRKRNRKPTDAACFTEAAQCGLTLPARGVLDLWQVSHWVLNNDVDDHTHKAEHIARTMLRNAIAESAMSSETGLRLQENIFRRMTPQGGTILNFWAPGVETMLKTFRLEWLDCSLRKYPGSLFEQGDTQNFADSRLELGHSKGMILRLICPPQSDGAGGKQPGDAEKAKDASAESGCILPDLVAAWLTVLHDVIRLGCGTDSSILAAPLMAPTVFVDYKRDGCTTRWRMPLWENFAAHEVNGKLWQNYLEKVRAGKLFVQTDQDMLRRLLAAGWAACALETFLAFVNPGVQEQDKEFPKPPDILSSFTNINTLFSQSEEGAPDTRSIGYAENYVMKAAARIYERILDDESGKGSVLRENERTLVVIRNWLEYSLPLLLSDKCVSAFNSDPSSRTKEIASLNKTVLAKFWKANKKNWETWAASV